MKKLTSLLVAGTLAAIGTFYNTKANAQDQYSGCYALVYTKMIDSNRVHTLDGLVWDRYTCSYEEAQRKLNELSVNGKLRGSVCTSTNQKSGCAMAIPYEFTKLGDPAGRVPPLDLTQFGYPMP